VNADSTANTSNERSAAQTAFVQIMRVQDRLNSQVASLLRRHKLTGPQYNVLRILRGAGRDGLPCHHIAGRMITRVPDITRLVDRLGSAGLAIRANAEDDRRVVRVRITPEARRLLSKLDVPVRELHRRQFSALNTTELESLNSFLESILSTSDERDPVGAARSLRSEGSTS
jgi:DNA-binding MarR family transcriptional regulator